MGKIFVYKNLHKKCWSIKSTKTNLVVSYGHNFILKDCVFKVRESARQRVIKEKRKNVHAGVQGFLTSNVSKKWIKISYNPYKAGYFYTIKDNRPIYSAEFVKFTKNAVYASM